jgi:hypothetical protein
MLEMKATSSPINKVTKGSDELDNERDKELVIGFQSTGNEVAEVVGNQAVIRFGDKYYFDLFALFFWSCLWTLLMTTIPVMATLQPNDYYAHHPNWYTGDDVARFLEPIGGFLFNFYILTRSSILKDPERMSYGEVLIFIFFLGSAIYGQGAGFHSASNMFKNGFESILTIHDDDVAKDFNYWLRNTWEHDVSHYVYATGYAMMSFGILWAFRSHCVHTEDDLLTPKTRCMLVVASLIYGLLIAGVAIDFPSGLIVGLLYVILYGFCCVGGYLYILHKNGVTDVYIVGKRRPVIQYFLLGYLVAFVIIILWIIAIGGIKNRSQGLG